MDARADASLGSIRASEAARRLGITVKTLKVYERHRIVRPERNLKGWRVYSRADLARLARALAYRRMGFALSQIAGLLDGDAAHVFAALAAQEGRLLRRSAELREALKALRSEMDRARPPLRLAA